MTQDFQMIGGVSPALERVAREKQGWQGSPAEDLGQEVTDASDYSQYDRRTNRQALGFGADLGSSVSPGFTGPVPNMAGYTEPSMASIDVTPPALPEVPAERDLPEANVTF